MTHRTLDIVLLVCLRRTQSVDGKGAYDGKNVQGKAATNKDDASYGEDVVRRDVDGKGTPSPPRLSPSTPAPSPPPSTPPLSRPPPSPPSEGVDGFSVKGTSVDGTSVDGKGTSAAGNADGKGVGGQKNGGKGATNEAKMPCSTYNEVGFWKQEHFNCTDIQGLKNIRVYGGNITSLRPLLGIQHVARIHIEGTSLTDLDGLESIVELFDTSCLAYGCHGVVKYKSASLTIRSNRYLQNIGHLSGIVQPRIHYVVIEDNFALTSLEGIGGIRAAGYVSIARNLNMPSFDPVNAMFLHDQFDIERWSTVEIADKACPSGSYKAFLSGWRQYTTEPPAHTVAEVRPQSRCVTCPEYKTSPGGTTYCTCNSGLWKDLAEFGEDCGCRIGNTMNHIEQKCEACTLGQDCDWDAQRMNASLSPPSILKGYWAEAHQSMNTFSKHSVFKCFSTETCLSNGVCATGREGQACGICLRGFYGGADGPCLPCHVTPSEAWITVGFGILLLIVFCYVLELTVTSTAMLNNIKNMRKLRVSVKQMVRHSQAVGLSFYISVPLPPAVSSLLRFCSKFAFDVGFVTRANCMVDSPTTLWRMLSCWSLPLLVALAACTTYLLSRLLSYAMSRCTHAKLRSYAPGAKVTYSSVLRLLFLLYSCVFAGIVHNVFLVFTCRSNPNEKYTVMELPHVECSTAEWWTLALPAIFAGALYVFTYIAALACMIHEVVKEYHRTLGNSRGQWNIACEDFRMSQVRFALILVGKDVVYNVFILATFMSPEWQLLMLTALMLCYTSSVVQRLPFEDPSNNVMEIWTATLLMVQLGVTAGMGYHVEGGRRGEIVLSAVLMLSLTLPIVILVFQLSDVVPLFRKTMPNIFNDLPYDEWKVHISLLEVSTHGFEDLRDILESMDRIERRRQWTLFASLPSLFDNAQQPWARRLSMATRNRASLIEESISVAGWAFGRSTSNFKATSVVPIASIASGTTSVASIDKAHRQPSNIGRALQAWEDDDEGKTSKEQL